jgi:membrane protease YdiL (CAAX protease family)
MYHRLARTDRYRWWKPILELVLWLFFSLLLVIVVVVPVDVAAGSAADGPLGLAVLGLSLAVLMPAAFLAARLTGRPWRGLLGVDGRLHWRWLGLCLAVALAQVVVQSAIEVAAAGLGHPVTPMRGAWVGWARFLPLALVVVAAIVPQAAAEEIVFRGTLMQALGAWVRSPWFAILVSSALFGLAHWLPLAGFVSTAAFGLVAAWLTIRTGGLEAAIALHVARNVSWFLLDAATGRSDRWVTEMFSDVSWGATLIDVPLAALAAAVIAILHGRPGHASSRRKDVAAEPDDLQLREGRYHHRLHEDERHTEQRGIDPAGEEQDDAVDGPDRVARDDRPDRATRQDIAPGEHRHEGRVG